MLEAKSMWNGVSVPWAVTGEWWPHSHNHNHHNHHTRVYPATHPLPHPHGHAHVFWIKLLFFFVEREGHFPTEKFQIIDQSVPKLGQADLGVSE